MAESVPEKRRGLDEEIQALARLDKILAVMDDKLRKRCLAWINSRYGDADNGHRERGVAG